MFKYLQTFIPARNYSAAAVLACRQRNLFLTSLLLVAGIASPASAAATPEALEGYLEWAGREGIPAAEEGFADSPAGDGIANLIKFASGLPAMERASIKEVRDIFFDLESGSAAMTFSRKPDQPAARLVPEWTRDLSGEWQVRGIGLGCVDAEGDRETWRAEVPLEGPLFMRLRVATEDEPGSPRYHSPFDVAISPDQEHIAVSDRAFGAVRILPVAAPAEENWDCVILHGEPTGIVWTSEGRLLVAEYGAGSVAEIELGAEGARIVRRIKTGPKPMGLALAESRNLLLVTEYGLNEIQLIDLDSGELRSTLNTGKHPGFVALTPDETLALVANLLPAGPATDFSSSAEVTVVDLQAETVLNRIALPAGASGVRQIAVSPNGYWAYVAHTLGNVALPTMQLDSGWVNTNCLSIIDLGLADPIDIEEPPVVGNSVIVDNTDSTKVELYAGSWSVTSGSGYYPPNFNTAGVAEAIATYRPDLEPGEYIVEVRYASGWSRLGNNVPYTVNHAGGSDTFQIDQRTGGGNWERLRSTPFTLDANSSVVIGMPSDGRACWDAIRFTEHVVAEEPDPLAPRADQKLLATVLLDYATRGAADPWGVALSDDGNTAWVSLAGVHELAQVDLASLHAHLDGSAAGTSAAMEGSFWHSYWAGLEGLDGLLQYFTAMDGMLERVPVAAKGPRGISANGDLLATVGYFSGNLLLMNVDTPEFSYNVPLGPNPAPNAYRRGEINFHDGSLSHQSWLSCATCHPDVRADGLNWDLLNDGIGTHKNTKSMMGSHHTPPTTWTGARADAFVSVASGYQHIHFAEVAQSIVDDTSTFLEAMRPEPSPYLVKGKLSSKAIEGRAIFNDPAVGCFHCHSGPWYTKGASRDVGTGGPDYIYDTPTLVEMWRSGPFLHDGRSPTLMDVITTDNPDDEHGRTSHLTEAQRSALVEYLLSL